MASVEQSLAKRTPDEGRKIKTLCQMLKQRDEETYRRFAETNASSEDQIFTVVFPTDFKFQYYRSLDSILIQLQILLCQVGQSYRTDCDIEDYYERLFQRQRGSKPLRFDLSRTSFIGDLELTMIHTLGYFCQKLSCCKIQTMFNLDKIEWMSRWNFFEHYDEWGEVGDDVKHMLLYPDTRDSERLIPIRKISDYSDVDRTAGELIEAKKITDLLKKQYGMDGRLIHGFVTDVISEICQNIPEHSKSLGFIIVHAHPELPDQRIPDIEISISDCGIGIRQSLLDRYPSRYENESHHKVIKSVLEGRFPMPHGQHRGGILRAKDFVGQFGGRIDIRSICAKAGNLSSYDDYDTPARFWRFFPGTQVRIMIPRLSVASAFDDGKRFLSHE